MNILQNLKNYWEYRKIVSKYEGVLAGPNYALRVDAICRMYTVINVPNDVALYGPEMTRDTVKTYLENTARLLNSIGLVELYSLHGVRKLNEHNYLVVFGYRYLDPRKMLEWALYAGVGLLAAGLLYGLVLFLAGL